MRGRPTLYKPEYAEQAAKLCALGAKDIEIADFFDVHLDTLYEWRNVHPDFSESIKVAKEAADTRVERGLYERATGYSYPAEKVVGGKIVKHREHVPPDPTSMIFWLKNRKPKEWRDRREQEITGASGAPLQVIISKADERL